MACRVPEPDAVAIINRHAERVVTVSDAEIKAAIRAFYKDTHNVVEGAGAAPLAALIKEKARMAGKKAAVMVSGGNIDAPLYRDILGEQEGAPA
jgi:threonine dehydratase